MNEKVIILPDIHLTTDIPKQYKSIKEFIKNYKADEIVLLGDFMDCESFNHWNNDKRKSMEGKRFEQELKLANSELDFLSKYCKRIVYIEGNHENWVEQYIERNPEFDGLINLQDRLELKERNIKWVPLNKLYKKGHLYFTHGCYTNKYHANKHLHSFGCNLVYGHTHRFDSNQMIMEMQKPYMAYGLGCLCGHEPDYMKGKPAAWITQFAVVEYFGYGDFNLYPINLINNKFRYGGKIYGSSKKR